MKKNKTVLRICIALLTALTIVAIYFFVDELYKSEWKFNFGMIKSVATISGLIFSIFSLIQKLRSKHPLRFYALSYSKQIGDAFSAPKQRKELKELLKATADYSQGNPKKSIQRLNKLRKKCVTNSDHKAVLLFTGLSYTELYMYTEAINTYKELLTYDALHSLSWSNLGNIYFEIKNYDEAIKCFESSTRFAPDYYNGWNNLAQVYLMTKEWEKAIDSATRALSLNPRMYQAESALSIAYFALNNTKKSEEHFEKAIASGAKKERIQYFMKCISSEEDESE